METPVSLLNLPDVVLLHTVSMLGGAIGVVRLREVCKGLRDLIDACALFEMMKVRWGDVICSFDSLENVIRALAAANSHRVLADDIRGVLTEDKRYWSRDWMEGKRGVHRVLTLIGVEWLALVAVFEVHDPSFLGRPSQDHVVRLVNTVSTLCRMWPEGSTA
jgi:hypothetical protein